MTSPCPPEAVLLDAYGTLLFLEPPAPRLGALLAREGAPQPREALEAALSAEMAHYRANTTRAGDADGLAALRQECAEVLADGLAGGLPPPRRLAEILIEAFVFRLYPDALDALDGLAGAGARLAVASNWDCGLPDVLSALGVLGRFEVVVTSATVGAPKPDPAIFLAALDRLDLAPDRVVHCGDEPALDGAGARAAGIRPVLVRRPPAIPGAGEIASLSELPAAVGYRARVV